MASSLLQESAHGETSMRLLRSLLVDESGHGMTEYAILIGTLALGAVVTMLAAGTKLHSVLTAPRVR
jgi:Flp pilus assembly pilin Flp